ncbi:MAG: DNA repair exonuclease [Candidatus Micrarchaeota archaeon]|nr:DNA repair exonuclease [Candidatus Micrarchaeota archaeon]
MKVAIVSDLHLGYERFAEDSYVQAEEALAKAAELSDMIIIPGDVFDVRNPRLEVLAHGVNIFRNLAKRQWKARVVSYSGARMIHTDIPIIVIPGTHERRAQGAGNSVELLSLAGLLVDVSDSTAEVEKGGERVAVFGLGGLSEEKVKEVLAQLGPKPVDGAFNIFMFHQSTHELLPFSKDFITFDDLPKGFDLYVDGHIHNKVIDKVHGKPFLIPGSTVLTQLKDGEQEGKGFFVFDTKTNAYEFIRINSREFYVESVKVDGKRITEIEQEVSKHIDKILAKSKEKPIIRIILEGEMKEGYKQADIDLSDTLKRYKEKAILEVSKGKIDDKETESEIESLRKGSVESVSVRDYGLSIFIEQLKKSGYGMKKSPSELFDLLSSDQKKDKIISEAMETLFAQ